MKKLVVSLLALVAVLSAAFSVFACAGGGSFEFETKPPSTANLYDEVYFKDYLKEELSAEYTLYVSYFNTETDTAVTDEKQEGLMYTFQYISEYDFKIVRELNGKESTLTCKIEVLPLAPAFTDAEEIRLESAATMTVGEIFRASGSVVTPSDLEEKLKVTGAFFTPTVYLTTDEVPDLSRRAIEFQNKTSFIFDTEGVYEIILCAENKSGSADLTVQITIVNHERATSKAELTFEGFDPAAKILTWSPVTGATKYRVWVGDGKFTDITECSYSMAELEDGVYTVHILPIYENKIYAASESQREYFVGKDLSPMEIKEGVHSIRWEKRYLVEKYVVTENNNLTTELGSDVTEYQFKGSYELDSTVRISLKAVYDASNETEESEATFEYGTVTLKKMPIFGGPNKVKSVNGIDYLELQGFKTDNFVMVEFTGKNAPSVAFRAKSAFSEIDTPVSGHPYAHPAGTIVWNSYQTIDNAILASAGFCVTGGDVGLRGVGNTYSLVTGKEGKGPGLANYSDDQKYIMILGVEEVAPEEGEKDLATGKLSCWIFTVDSKGKIEPANYGYAIVDYMLAGKTGDKVVLYGNRARDAEQSGPDGMTFRYYKVGNSLENLINRMDEGNPYKEQFGQLLEVSVENLDILPQANQKTFAAINLGAHGTSITKKAENVESVSFDATNDSTYFMVEFMGQNVPNFAVGATKVFTEIDPTVNNTSTGLLFTNSYPFSRTGLLGLNGWNNNKGQIPAWWGHGDVSGTSGKGVGMDNFVDGVHYLMIIGAQRTGSNWSLVCKVFSVESGILTLLSDITSAKTVAIGAALPGTKAVIYPSVDIEDDAKNVWHYPKQITFRYAVPQSSVSALVDNMENAEVKTQLRALIENS